ncbi:MAG: sulfatase, partial [Planctomycetota bacterium]
MPRKTLAVIVAAGVVAAIIAVVLVGLDSGPKGLNVVLISIDTCRADHLGPYDATRSLTPHIDAFAAGATVFENCVSAVPLTLPSHTTMLTGLIPLAHGAHQNGVMISPDLLTLPEILHQRGYATGAVVSHLVLGKQFLIDQGFDTYDDEMSQPGPMPGERRGARTSALAGEWLAQRAAGDQPLFLFAHYFDPHDPYQAPPEFADRFGPSDAEQYAAEIAYVDQCIGQLFDQLKRLGIYDSSLIIVTGDHGEMLGEHGELDHGYYVYESAIKVPLIVKLPGLRDARRVTDVVGMVDVTPTVCSVVGASPPDGI